MCDNNNQSTMDSCQPDGLRRATVADPNMTKANRERKSVHCLAQANTEVRNVDASGKLCQPAMHEGHARRRVSFGDLPAAPTRGPLPDLHAQTIPERAEPTATVVCASHSLPEVTGDGGDSLETGAAVRVGPPEGLPEELKGKVLEVQLGLLGQHTIYGVTFVLSDAMLDQPEFRLSQKKPPSVCPNSAASGCEADVELVRAMEAMKFNRGIDVEVGGIKYDSQMKNHEFQIKVTTHNEPHISESYILRKSTDHSLSLELIFRATALSRNHGTPSLRVGIHKLGHTPEYDESDTQTEWQEPPADE